MSEMTLTNYLDSIEDISFKNLVKYYYKKYELEKADKFVTYRDGKYDYVEITYNYNFLFFFKQQRLISSKVRILTSKMDYDLEVLIDIMTDLNIPRTNL